jgi:hypothetical protein
MPTASEGCLPCQTRSLKLAPSPSKSAVGTPTPLTLEQNIIPPTQEAESFDLDLASGPRGRFDDPSPLQLETGGLTSYAPNPPRANPQKSGQSEFWATQTQHKFSIAAKLRQAKRPDLAEKLEDCHSHFTHTVCNSCGKTGRFPNRCDQFYCPECQPRLARERKESVEWWAREIAQPKHVVLTVTNTHDLTQSHVHELKHCFTKLRNRTFTTKTHHWWECKTTGHRTPIAQWQPQTDTHHTITSYPWRGGFYGIEVTNEGRGWHLHLHALIDSRFIDGPELARQWSAVTNGYGKIVNVKDCRHTDYLAEVTKYAVKGSQLASWSPDEVVQFIEAFSGVRTFGVFGSLYGKRTEFAEWLDSIRQDKPLCSCGSCDLTYYTEAEWLMRDLVPDTPSRPRPPTPTQHHELQLEDPRCYVLTKANHPGPA